MPAPAAEAPTPPEETLDLPETPETKPTLRPLSEAAAVPETIAAPAGEPVHAKIAVIDGPADVIQWRVDAGEWKNARINDTQDGVITLRTGLGASVTLILADQVSVRVGRLSRIRLEQRTSAQAGMPVELVVDVQRGEVDIKPLPVLPGGAAPAVVRIVTPDKSFTTRLATGVRFDAFSGTRTRTISGEK